MDRETAFTTIATAVETAKGGPAAIAEDTDLVGEQILDSLDAMVFLMEIETATGLSFPEDADLVEMGVYRVPTLIDMMVAAPSPS